MYSFTDNHKRELVNVENYLRSEEPYSGHSLCRIFEDTRIELRLLKPLAIIEKIFSWLIHSCNFTNPFLLGKFLLIASGNGDSQLQNFILRLPALRWN